MAATETSTRPRTYGNWRRPAPPGLGSLGTIGTGLLLVGLIAVILTMALVGVIAALAVAGGTALFLTTLVVRNKHHRTGLQRLTARVGYRLARRRGHTEYRSGPISPVPWGTHQLPGMAAGSQLSEWTDSWGRPFALLHLPYTGDYTVVFACEPDGASLVDQAQIDSWVAHWGGWLAGLSDEPGVLAAQVTIETAPDTGHRLRTEIEANLDLDAPPLALAMMREVESTYPQGSAGIRAWVALTFTATPPGGRRRRTEEMGKDLATRVPGLGSGLSSTGAGPARPVAAQELCEIVRTAYDPHAGRLLDAARAAGEDPTMLWSEVGPAGHHAGWDVYRHGPAWSVTWAMSQAPRGEVFSNVLAQLLAPHRDVDRKRVSLLYRPIDSAKAARIVEQDKRAADFRVTSSQRPSARNLADQRAAYKTGEEEAAGAGLVNFGLLATATVVGLPRLPAAVAAVDNLSASARLLLRRVEGSQDSTFLANLPLGLVLSRHLSVPTEIREAL